MMLLRVLCVAVVQSIAGANTAHAQDATLTNIEHLVASGRMTDARTALERWNGANPLSARVAAPVRAQALLLTARLAVDPAEAEVAYQSIALSYPTTAQAPEALLRLGQGLVTAAELGTRRDAIARAAGYLERLISDYPRSAHGATGRLWLVRAHALAGRNDRACDVARTALNSPIADDDLSHMLRIEFSSQCDG